MSKISLPFHRQGAAFQPVLYISDLRRFEEDIEAAIKADKPSGIIQARANLLAAALERDQPGVKVDIQLPTRDINRYFNEVYRAAGDYSDDDPLASPDA